MKKDENVRVRKRRKGPKVPRYYPLPVEGKFRMKGQPPPIPKFAYWGFHDYHAAIKVLILSVFLAFVSLTTPFWAYVDDATFGLWMYCNYASCTSIHDNLVEGGSVPAWYHMTQGSFCIGTVACLVALGILVHNVYGKQLKMTSTVHTTAVCVLGISVIQMTMALYTFTSYFEHTNFLYHIVDFEDQEIDFHGAFYCGLVSTILNAVAAIIILLDDDITKASNRTQMLMNAAHRRTDPAKLQALYEEYALKKYYDGVGYTSGEVDLYRGFAKNVPAMLKQDNPVEGLLSHEGQYLDNWSNLGDLQSQMTYYPDQPPPYTEINDDLHYNEAPGPKRYYDGPENYYDNFNYMWEGTGFPNDTIVEEEFIPLPCRGEADSDSDAVSNHVKE